MRSTPSRPALAAAGAALLALTGPAWSQASDQPTRPIELTVNVRDEAPRCEPAELRVPAEMRVDLRIRNFGQRSVEIRAPDLFRSDAVLSVTGANQGQKDRSYIVDPAQNAQMIVKSPVRGQYPFHCVDPGTPAGPAEGQGTLTSVR